MTTREKILEQARRMFNTLGMESASAKMIANELSISDGNLRYHFRTKEDLVYALYMQLVEGFDRQFAPFDTVNEMNIDQIYQSLHTVYGKLYAHRYLMADFMAIMRKYPKIAQHYRELTQQRKQQFRRVLKVLKASDILNNDISEKQYEQLMEQFNLLSDTWIGHAEVFMEKSSGDEKVLHYVRLAFSIIAPYLTEKGKVQYEYALTKK